MAMVEPSVSPRDWRGRMRARFGAFFHLLAVCLFASARATWAQVPVSREEAVASAMTQGARLGIARADTAIAFAQLLTARALQNPTLSTVYSKAVPNYHVTMDLPFDFPFQRSARIGSARASRLASQYRFAFERAAAALDADTTYTRAVAARARAQLSRRNAQDSDSLRRMVVARRDAGDASDLDVELATVTAGQAANAAAADSLTYLSTVLDLQVVMGLAADRVAVVPTDSLIAPPAPAVPADSAVLLVGSPLQVAAALASVEAARLAVRLQRRSIFTSPSILAGIETGDPGEPGILPTFGLSIPIPLFNRNRGPIRQAEAEHARARAELALVEVQSRAEIARTRRELAIALAKLQRDRILVVAANRVAAMSLTAYREGAASLPNVLEAQRNAREVLAQYVDDLADAWIFAAELRVLTLTPTTSAP
jgi:outer membrane protein, heavy metal efflux system